MKKALLSFTLLAALSVSLTACAITEEAGNLFHSAKNYVFSKAAGEDALPEAVETVEAASSPDSSASEELQENSSSETAVEDIPVASSVKSGETYYSPDDSVVYDQWFGYDEYGRQIFTYNEFYDNQPVLNAELRIYNGNACQKYTYTFSDSFLNSINTISTDEQGHWISSGLYQVESFPDAVSCSYNLNYTYDAATRTATAVTTDGSLSSHFDENNNLLYTEVTLADGSQCKTCDYTYDSDGNILRQIMSDTRGNVLGDVSYTHEKDAQNRIIKVFCQSDQSDQSENASTIIPGYLEMDAMTPHPFDGYWEADDGSFILFSIGTDRGVYARGDSGENGLPLLKQFGYYYVGEDQASVTIDGYDISNGSCNEYDSGEILPEVIDGELHAFDQVYIKN